MKNLIHFSTFPSVRFCFDTERADEARAESTDKKETKKAESASKKIDRYLKTPAINWGAKEIQFFKEHKGELSDEQRRAFQSKVDILVRQQGGRWSGRVLGLINNNLQEILSDTSRSQVASRLEQEASLDQIDKYLRSPLTLSLKGIRYLEERSDLLNEKQKGRFRELASFLYETGQKNTEYQQLVPPKALILLRQCDGLWEMLNPQLRHDIDVIMSREEQSLDKILSKDVEEWTKSEASRICGLHNHILKSSHSEERKEKVGQGLSQWVGKVLARQHNSQSTPEEISPTEKLIILEAQRLLRGSSYALETKLNQELRPHLERLAQDTAKSLVNEANNPDILLVWDLIEDIEPAGLTEEEQAKLEGLVEYGNASYFLYTIQGRGQKVLTQMEFEALQDIASATWNAPKFERDSFERKLRRKPIDEKIIAIDEKLKEFQLKNRADYQKAMKIAYNVQPEKEDEFYAAQNAFTSAQEEAASAINQAVESMQQSIERLEYAVPGLDEYTRRVERYAQIEDEEEKEKQYKGLIEEFYKYLEKCAEDPHQVPIERRAEEEDEAYKTRQASMRPEYARALQGYRAPFEAFQQSQEAFEKLKKEVKTKWDEYHKSSTEKLNKEKEELRKQYDESAQEQDMVFELLEYFDIDKQQDLAQKYYSQFFKDLEYRIGDHKIYAHDLDVLWQEDFAEKMTGSANDEGLPEKTRKVVEIRHKIQEALFGAGGEEKGIIDQIDFDPNSDPKTWAEQVRQALSSENLLAEVEKAGDDDLIENPQVRREIVHGIRQHFRGAIIDSIKGRLPGGPEEKLRFWNELQNLFTIHQPREVGIINEKHQQFDQHEADKTAAIDQFQKQMNPLTEGIENPDEKEKLEELTDYWGGQVHEFDTQLNHLNLQTPLEQKRFAFLIDTVLKQVLGFHEQIKKHEPGTSLPKIDEGVLDDFAADWGKTKSELQLVLSQMAKANPYFAEYLRIKVSDEALEQFDQDIGSLIESLRTGTTKPENPLWDKIARGGANTKNLCDFNNGFLRDKVSNELHNDLKDVPENIKDLAASGFFQDPLKAQSEFGAMNAEFNAAFQAYRDNVRKIQGYIRGDMNMDDNKFIQKYGSPKEYFDGILKGYDDSINFFDQELTNFNQPDFFQNWLEKYNTDAEGRAKAIQEFSDWKKVTDSLDEMKQQTTATRDWLGEYKSKRWDKFKLHKRVKFNYFSLRDVYELFKQIFEKLEKNRKRKSDRAVGMLGMKIFGKDSDYGREFVRMSRSSEKERIDEWKTAYQDEEGWIIKKNLYRSNDQDEIRACMDLLLEKGYLMWEDPKLWEVFNRMQGQVVFSYPKDKSLSNADLKKKIKGACEAIWWSGDVFRSWEDSFDDNHKKAQGAFKKEFDDLVQEGGHHLILIDMLARWKRGEDTEVNPARYEAFLRQAFEIGKMNGQPDKRWYYLIMGLTIKNPRTGQTILSRSTLSRFQDLMQGIPVIEFFADVDSGTQKLNGEIVPKGTPGAHDGAWDETDFEAWKKMLGGDDQATFQWDASAQERTSKFFYHVIMASETARGRASRTQNTSTGKVDHDDGEMFATFWDYEAVCRELVLQSHASGKYSDDFWRNLMYGYDRYFRETLAYIEEKDKQFGDNPEWLDIKDKRLREVGNRIKAAFAVTQSMAGNYEQQGKRVVTFDKNKWEAEGVYSQSASKSRSKIENLMGKLLEDGNQEKFKELFGTSSDRISQAEIFKKRNELNGELYQLDDQLFENSGRIQRVLSDYVHTTGGYSFDTANDNFAQFFGSSSKKTSSANNEYQILQRAA